MINFCNPGYVLFFGNVYSGILLNLDFICSIKQSNEEDLDAPAFVIGFFITTSEIAKTEEKFVNKESNSIAIYIGMAFCPTRCYYCSFPANPLKQFGHLRMEYVQKLIEEVKGMAKILKDTNKEIETLYIGGGRKTRFYN